MTDRAPAEQSQAPGGPTPRPPAALRHGITWREALRVWTAVGLQSFGGPAGQIAVMHRILVEEKRWIGEQRFLHALNYCMILPGPEAMQLATYIGWLMHRTLGGVVAGVLFVLPGFLSILGLSMLYAMFQGAGPVEAVFFGIKPAVIAIVLHAVLRIGRRVLKNAAMLAIAGTAFIGIFFYKAPFPLIILGAAAVGMIGGQLWPRHFAGVAHGSHKPGPEGLLDTAIGEGVLDHTRPSWGRAVRTLVVWGFIWLAPVAALVLWLGAENVYARQAVFFSKAAVVTFGGAYSVLAYVAQQAVEQYGWLLPTEMLDGLGMAEGTPGPLIQVVQYVGFMGAVRDAGPLHPLLAGVLASVLVTWVTFVPCFLWIFLGAPYIEALRGDRLLAAALSAITAAVVGVILNLAIWFALHTLFAELEEARFAGARLLMPRLPTLDVAALAITLLAVVLIFRARWGMMRVLLVCAGAGVALWLVR